MLARAAKMYQTVDLESAPKTQILERLFDRFARDVAEAQVAITARDIHAKAAAIDHAARIVIELRAALDHGAAPELAGHLDLLYGFVADRLTEASMKMLTAPLGHATRVMTTLSDAFRKAHQEMSAHRDTRQSLVDALLAATPVVPEGVPDQVLLDAARVMVATRAAILATAELAPLVPTGEGVLAASEKIAELSSRQTAWNEALAEARSRTGSQRVATGKLRAYRTRQP